MSQEERCIIPSGKREPWLRKSMWTITQWKVTKPTFVQTKYHECKRQLVWYICFQKVKKLKQELALNLLVYLGCTEHSNLFRRAAVITSASLDSYDKQYLFALKYPLQHVRCMPVQTLLNVYRSLKAEWFEFAIELSDGEGKLTSGEQVMLQIADRWVMTALQEVIYSTMSGCSWCK